jgi:anti-repressor protein
MNNSIELVFQSSKGNPVTNSLIVAEMFEKNHQHVMEAIRNLITTVENSTVENCAAKFFHKSTYQNSQNKQQPMYIMNRDGFSLLVMGFTGDKALKFKIAFIEAFNHMEQKLRATIAIPQNFAEALELAAKQARQIDEKNKLIEKQAPAVDFVARAIDNGNLTDIGQASKILKLPFGRNTFFKTLREQGVFFKNRNEPKQEYIERKYFELREKEIPRDEHPAFMVTKILVTKKGLFWLAGMFKVDYPSTGSVSKIV